MSSEIEVQTTQDITYDMLYDSEDPGDGRDFRVAIPAGTRGKVLSTDEAGVTVDFAGSDYDWIVQPEWLSY